MRTDRQADRHDEANSRYSQFCERASKDTETTCFDNVQIVTLSEILKYLCVCARACVRALSHLRAKIILDMYACLAVRDYVP